MLSSSIYHCSLMCQQCLLKHNHVVCTTTATDRGELIIWPKFSLDKKWYSLCHNFWVNEKKIIWPDIFASILLGILHTFCCSMQCSHILYTRTMNWYCVQTIIVSIDNKLIEFLISRNNTYKNHSYWIPWIYWHSERIARKNDWINPKSSI